MSRRRSAILFIHGLWVHPSSWAPWLRLFDEHDYEPSAPAWPGVASTVEETRANPDAVADWGIEHVTDHFVRILDDVAVRPVVIGHSFGGVIAEKLLEQGRAAAAIAIGAAQIKGVPPFSSMRVMMSALKNPANRHRAVSLTADQFRYSFGNALDEGESDELYARWTIPAPALPLFEVAAANFSLAAPGKVETEAEPGPLLLVTAGKDHTIPADIIKSSFDDYRDSSGGAADVVGFADRGHSLVIDSGWREVADACLVWLDKYDL